MNDRELLELAAKAAGITGWQSKHGYWNMVGVDGEKHVCCNDWPRFCPNTGVKLNPTFADAVEELYWNPLTDDGDALRLVVKLHLTIDRSEIKPAAVVYCDYQGLHFFQVIEDHGTDPYAATRRAIVRAAAEIGKEMK